MPKYLVQAKYTAAGVRGLQKDSATARRAAILDMLESCHGKLETFYYTMGVYDVVFIVDLPEVWTAKSVALTISATGLATIEMTSLLSVEETDMALRHNLVYRSPGQGL